MTAPVSGQPKWDRVVGQDKAVALLQRAANVPSTSST